MFSFEVLDLQGTNASLTVTVEHKNADDTAWTTLVGIAAATTTGVVSAGAAAIKEQIRFSYVVGGSAATAMIYFNMLTPAWRPY